MSYKEDLYKNCLKAIEKLYEDSKYNSEIDLFRSFDIINSVNTNQLASKEHLTKAVFPIINSMKYLTHIAILGSWYGLLGIMLRQHISDEIYIDNIDSDPETKFIGKRLHKHDRNRFIVGDAVGYTLNDKLKKYQLIINTSCEHMEQEDLLLITQAKHRNAVICFQSNNYFSIDSHINCSNSLEEFENSLNLIDIMHASTLEVKPENYERYTVIGR